MPQLWTMVYLKTVCIRAWVSNYTSLYGCNYLYNYISWCVYIHMYIWNKIECSSLYLGKCVVLQYPASLRCSIWQKQWICMSFLFDFLRKATLCVHLLSALVIHDTCSFMQIDVLSIHILSLKLISTETIVPIFHRPLTISMHLDITMTA